MAESQTQTPPVAPPAEKPPKHQLGIQIQHGREEVKVGGIDLANETLRPATTVTLVWGAPGEQ